MIKLSDYLMQRIAAEGVRHVFLVPGGAAMHLNDSLGKSAALKYVSTFHEYASSIAAEAAGKYAGNLGVAMVTAGPGSTNAVTGVASAWVNSSPLLVLSGQVKRADLKGGSAVRQMGVQEIDIEAIVRPITKYAATVTDPSSIRFHLEKAIALARGGRPGPVWLSIPLDVQACAIDPASLEPFQPATEDRNEIAGSIGRLLEVLDRSERPLILAGQGIRIAGAGDVLLEVVRETGIPVQTTWEALDLVPGGHPFFAGRPGSVASRSANFALQTCDFLLCVGARLDLATVGYARERVAPRAFRAAVDVDPAELEKIEKVFDLLIRADAGVFLRELLRRCRPVRDPGRRSGWRERIDGWSRRYPVVSEEYRGRPEGTSMYVLFDALSEMLTETDVVVQGSSGIQSEIFFLVFRPKAGQRVLADGSFGSMGYGLPAAIGAAVASGRRTVLVDGDGSFQPNVQELETVRRLGLPLKIVVVNNGGYASIRSSQDRYFQRRVAADPASGLTLPSIKAIATAYGIPHVEVEREADLAAGLARALEAPGPAICEVRVPAEEDRVPRIASVARADGSMESRPLEDLFPFLDREELERNLRGDAFEN